MSLPHDPVYAMYLGDVDRRYPDTRGTMTHALALTDALVGALAPDERLVAFCSAAAREELGDVASRGRIEIVPVAASQGFGRQLQHDQWGVARLVARSGADVIHFPNGRAPWRSLAPAKVVATIDDDVPTHYRAGGLELRQRDVKTAYVMANVRRTLETANAILASSERSRRQLEDIVPGRADAIRVVRPGVTIGDRRGRAAAARTPRFVVFDSPSPHDHADEAADFALQYVVERGLTDHKIVLIGTGRGAAVRNRCPERFENEPTTSPDRVGELVRSSRAVIVASRDEGFRPAAAEAWAHGTPAVVADCEAACELLHGVPGLYRGGDDASFAAALDRVLTLDTTSYHAWSKLVNLRLGWSRAATEVLSVYRALIAAETTTEPQPELVS